MINLLLAKTKLIIIEVLISRVVFNELVLVTSALREYDDMKEEVNNPKT